VRVWKFGMVPCKHSRFLHERWMGSSPRKWSVHIPSGQMPGVQLKPSLWLWTIAPQTSLQLSCTTEHARVNIHPKIQWQTMTCLEGGQDNQRPPMQTTTYLTLHIHIRSPENHISNLPHTSKTQNDRLLTSQECKGKQR
jgi:hypothetical protein